MIRFKKSLLLQVLVTTSRQKSTARNESNIMAAVIDDNETINQKMT